MLALAAELGVPLYAANGLCERLWGWAADYAEDGQVGRWGVAAIEAACAWDGDRGALVAALVRCRLLDGDGDSLAVHDWRHHRPPYVADRERKRAVKHDIPRNCSGGSAESLRNLRGVSAETPEEFPENCRPSQPNPTQPNPTKGSPTQGSTSHARARERVSYPAGFDSAWGAYPHHGTRSSKSESFAVWCKRGLELHAEGVVAWIEAAKGTDDWQREGGRYVPAMQVWLKRHDFTEPPPSPPRAPSRYGLDDVQVICTDPAEVSRE